MGHVYSISVNVPLALRYFLRRMYVSSKSFAIFFYIKFSRAKRCHNRLRSTARAARFFSCVNLIYGFDFSTDFEAKLRATFTSASLRWRNARRKSPYSLICT